MSESADADSARVAWIRCADGRIAELGVGPAPSDAIDLGGSPIAPGFIDLQVNGVDHDDFARTTPEGFVRAGRTLAAHGVVAYCPTICTAPLDSYDATLGALHAAQQIARDRPDLPEILGVHLEGPFLGAAPGAHPVELIRPVDLDWLRALLANHRELIRIVTLAPEADPGFEAIRLLRDHGVTVAIGHSRASYETAVDAATAGATIVTHLFNGMGPLHHREPGLAGAALDDDRLTPTVIADFVHVHPAALRLAIARKRNVALVTDAVAVDGTDAIERGGAAYLPDGTLAGSTLQMDRAITNVIGLGVPVERAAEMAATIPAELLGLADRGRLVVGAVADFVTLDPETHELRNVWIRGTRVSR
jgi:N-acetylglucosamine-6-phosphate deacetylase